MPNPWHNTHLSEGMAIKTVFFLLIVVKKNPQIIQNNNKNLKKWNLCQKAFDERCVRAVNTFMCKNE